MWQVAGSSPCRVHRFPHRHGLCRLRRPSRCCPPARLWNEQGVRRGLGTMAVIKRGERAGRQGITSSTRFLIRINYENRTAGGRSIVVGS